MNNFYYMTVVDTRADGMYVLRVYEYVGAHLVLSALRMACRDEDVRDVLAALDARGGMIYDPTVHDDLSACYVSLGRLATESFAAHCTRPGSSLCVVRRGPDPGLVYPGAVPRATYLRTGFFDHGTYRFRPKDEPTDARLVRACPEMLHLSLQAAEIAAL